MDWTIVQTDKVMPPSLTDSLAGALPHSRNSTPAQTMCYISLYNFPTVVMSPYRICRALADALSCLQLIAVKAVTIFFLKSYKQYKPTTADGLQYLVVEQYKIAKPISDSNIILLWLLN